jgi:hypothetical protein
MTKSLSLRNECLWFRKESQLDPLLLQVTTRVEDHGPNIPYHQPISERRKNKKELLVLLFSNAKQGKQSILTFLFVF